MTARPFPLHTGIATIESNERLTERMMRFTLSAPAFADFGVEQPGEIITLGWPSNGEPLVLPERGWRFAGGREQHWRNFTVRALDRASGTVDVDFFLHGTVGHAATWAAQAVAGDEVGFAGPRLHWEPDPEASWSLLVADETGLPALLAILETLPAGQCALAVAEVADDGERQSVSCAAELELHWAFRDGRAPGTTSVLLDAVRELSLPEGRGQAWGGGEALAMRDLRRHLAERRPDTALDVLGYWKHRTTSEW